MSEQTDHNARTGPFPAMVGHDAHYRRTRELLTYANDQVGKRRALAAALRRLGYDLRLDADTRAWIADTLAANGP